jgi:hypothetical protein
MEVTQKPFTRKKPDQLVYVELGSGNGGMLLSISEEGFRFRAVSPLRANGLMPFAFSFDGNQRLQGIGEVELLEDDGKSGGMRFVEVSPDFRSALDQWLALDSSRGKSGREVTRAAATPLDTMEKIREELRRGYPQAPTRPSVHKESQEASSDTAAPAQETSAEKSEPDSQPRQARPSGDSVEQHVAGDNAAEQPEQIEGKKQEHPDVRRAAPATERQQRNQTPSRPNRPNDDRARSSEQRSQPFYPPPFTHSAEREPPASGEQANSAFLKKPSPEPPSARVSGPAENGATRSAFSESQPAAPVAPERSQTREQAHVSAEALRRPFRQESQSRSKRPYIPPPVDESFEAAWERAKLTAPPESPHLSRAAAGSIIGVPLAVILGALAFNFRQDIGTLVIDLGQRISGEHRAGPSSSPGPSSLPALDTKSESQPASDAGAGAGTTGTSTQPASSASSPTGSQGVAAGSAHDAPSSPMHDTSSGASRENGVTRGSSPASSAGGTASRTPAGATGSSAAPPLSAESAANPAANLAIGTEPGSGQEEFNVARELLRGDHRHRDLSKAIDLLWAGVRKGYVPAEVTLADLYRRGDGVEKNCDQAQVLLVAASKKGSPEARQMLEKMAEEGCSE